MGAYAACLFAPLAPGCTVVAFAPQSSLSRADAPFERRYRSARRRYDWHDPRWRDAARGVGAIGQGYLVHDPLIPEDRMHAARLAAPAMMALPWPHLTHKIPPSLRRMGILKPMALAMLEGRLTRPDFFAMLRARRTSPPYVQHMLNHASDKGHHRLVRQALAAIPDDFGGFRMRQIRRANRQAIAAMGADQDAG